MVKLKDLLTEGVLDKGILKAVFMAGGPGSGKSYVARELFGIPKKINVSVSGLKTVNSDSEFEFLLKKYGFETVGGGLDIDLWPDDVFQMVAVGDEDYETLVQKEREAMAKFKEEHPAVAYGTEIVSSFFVPGAAARLGVRGGLEGVK